MSFTTCFILMQGIIVFAQAMSEEQLAMVKALAIECKEKEGATDDDFARVMSGKLPITSTGKCLHACMQELVGLTQDGKFSSDGAFQAAKQFFKGDEKMIAVMKEVDIECGPLADADRCELALKVMECGREGVKRHGVTMAQELF